MLDILGYCCRWAFVEIASAMVELASIQLQRAFVSRIFFALKDLAFFSLKEHSAEL